MLDRLKELEEECDYGCMASNAYCERPSITVLAVKMMKSLVHLVL